MIALLGESFLETYGLLLLLIVGLMVIMFILPNMANKKQYQQQQNFINTLKVGDKVKTTSGFYGTIVSIRDTTDGKIALLEMGEGKKVGYITVDIRAIYAVDQKEDIVRDNDGNIISPESMVEPAVEEPKSEEIKPAESATETENAEENNETLLDGETVEKPKTKKTKTKNKTA